MFSPLHLGTLLNLDFSSLFVISRLHPISSLPFFLNVTWKMRSSAV
jgi:hypothetical protein